MQLTIDAEATVQDALQIPACTHVEAGRLSQVEYERVLALLETLSDGDRAQPTYCTDWTVRDMVAHLAGAATGSTSFAEFRRQNVSNPYVKQFDDPVDGTNKLQIEERADKSTVELVAEFRQSGQIAVNKRQRLPWPVRKFHLPMGSLGFASLEYLMDVIYPRDQWMHRYDICAATDKEMIVTPDHDGRIVALVILDIAKRLHKLDSKPTVLLQLTGPLEAGYRFGTRPAPDCTVAIDCFAFNLAASGRITSQEAWRRATITGDDGVATRFLQSIQVPY